MNLPGSAADPPKKVPEYPGDKTEDRDIVVLVHGEKVEFTKAEALALASRLTIAVEVAIRA